MRNRLRLPLLLATTALTTVLLAPRIAGAMQIQESPGGPSSRPTVSARPDSTVEARLRRVFAEIEAFRDITVEVSSGVVHLRGTVVQPQSAERAETLASRLEGVLYVVNDLTTETGVETRLTPALENMRESIRDVVSHLPVAAVALIVVLLFGLAGRSIGRWEEVPKMLSISPLVWQLMRRVVQGGIVFIGLLLAFDILGVTSMIGAVLGTAGVAGLAIGFAFQDIIENYLAGALLSIHQPFHVNDVVEVAGHEGRVVRMTARELVLLTFEGNHVRLPNATVFKSPTTNYTRNPRRLFSFEIGIGVLEDLAEVARIATETLRAMNGVLDDPVPFARVQEIGDSSVVLRVHGWVSQRDSDFFKVRSEAIRLVKVALDEAEVDMPEPTYRLMVWTREDAPTAGTAASSSASAIQQGRSVDIAPDGKLEAQVEEDLAGSDEPNFLAGPESS